MPELTVILAAKRKSQHEQNRFNASIQGVDLDSDGDNDAPQTTFEDIKARAFSGGQAQSGNDILALQGRNASSAGFGIGNGLELAMLDETDGGSTSW